MEAFRRPCPMRKKYSACEICQTIQNTKCSAAKTFTKVNWWTQFLSPFVIIRAGSFSFSSCRITCVSQLLSPDFFIANSASYSISACRSSLFWSLCSYMRLGRGKDRARSRMQTENIEICSVTSFPLSNEYNNEEKGVE